MLISCVDNDNTKHTAVVTQGDNLIEYANNISVFHYKSGYYINIQNSWSDDYDEYYLYPDSLELPKELLPKHVIRTPVKKVIAYSSTQWSVFQKLGEISRIKGILESSYTNNAEIKRLISENKIYDVGTESCLNTEKVIDIQPDMIIYSPYQKNQQKTIEGLSGATVFPFADFLENHPLGRAEWLKIIGYLTCREKDTDSWFDNIVTNYESIKSLCKKIAEKPTIFSDLPFEGQWYIPGGNSYIAKIFEDASAEYIFNDNESTGSKPVDAETVLSKACNADYWRIMNSTNIAYSYNRLSLENELFTCFKAFKEKKIIICDVRNSAYFEKSQYEPDFVLKDFAYIFHPELFEENYEPHYFYLLND